jgi:hypothetical protein
MMLARALVLAALGLVTARAPVSAAPETIHAVLHVHSTVTTGALTLDELAETAAREKVQAVFLSENYLLRVEYSLPPFRALTRVTWTERGVLDEGLERYLALVGEAQRRHPDVLLIPGVEVMPHYHWDGAPWTLDMTVRDTQKNLLVFGLTDPAALAALPSPGNPGAGHYGWQSALDAAPALLVVPGLAVLFTRRHRRIRIGHAVVVVRQRRWALGGALVLVGVAALVRGWPFTVDRYPTSSDAGLVPHQELIDDVGRLGGVTVWSFPEARDLGETAVGPIQVRHRTDPYADDLVRTVRYTAFGAVYEDTTSFEHPGAGWDGILARYAAGERSRPAWAVGESGFHEYRAGKRVGTVQTVLLETDKTVAGVLDAFRRGRMYALRRTPELGLDLDGFTIRSGDATAGSGGTLRVAAGAVVEVSVGLTASDGSAQPVRVTLVRNGAVVNAWTVTTPFATVHRETFDGHPLVFRVDARGSRPHRLLTNPIFVRPS